jgi:alpha-glucosidase
VAIPTSWDDTKVLDGRVGEFVLLARRSGADWHVGAMTAAARTLKVPLRFLGPGRFTAEVWHDDEAARHGLSRRLALVTAADELTLTLSGAGGGYVRLVPSK